MTRLTAAAIVLVLLVAGIAPAVAHVPGDPGDNTTPERAVAVPDPAKSWSYYDDLDSTAPQYYRVTVDADQRLLVGAFTPIEGAFTPSLVVMSESIDRRDDVPEDVEVPEGMGAIVVEGERPDGASYEPFAPSANYPTAEFERSIDSSTTYLIALYEPEGRLGPAGVSIGYRESFTAVEYATVPFDLVETHLWQGQHPALVFGPLAATVLLGALVVRSRWTSAWSRTWHRYALAGGGLLVLASGVRTLVQMGVAFAETGPVAAGVVTAFFVVVPVVTGGWAVGHATSDRLVFTPRLRVGLLAAGGAALITWAGFVVAPAVLVLLAVTPGRIVSAP